MSQRETEKWPFGRTPDDPDYHSETPPTANSIREACGYGSVEEPRDPWQHRSKGMKCHTCMWYVTKVDTLNVIQEVGRCRRHAPTMSGYPVVYPTDWCGDHKLDQEKL
jgi:hypothetical protein